MEYKINRYEKGKNHNGDIISIFLAVTADDILYEYFLTADEIALVLSDEANIKPIINRCYAQASLRLEDEIATKPQDSILMDDEKEIELESMKDDKEIKDSKDKIKKDRKDRKDKKDKEDKK